MSWTDHSVPITEALFHKPLPLLLLIVIRFNTTASCGSICSCDSAFFFFFQRPYSCAAPINAPSLWVLFFFFFKPSHTNTVCRLQPSVVLLTSRLFSPQSLAGCALNRFMFCVNSLGVCPVHFNLFGPYCAKITSKWYWMCFLRIFFFTCEISGARECILGNQAG